ncbi:MAG: glycosyltransferase family 2 protein [Pseudomonadota bacterium]
MYHGQSIGVVIPAFNEERFIPRTLGTMPGFVDRVAVVDDGSRDGTADQVREIGDPRVVLIRHDQNRGVGGAILTGYRHLLDAGLDVLVVMAGDGQMDPADLPALLDPVIEGTADHTKGNRLYHPDTPRVMPAWRLVGNVALSLLTRITAGYPDVVDSQCGYTATRAEILSAVDLDRVYPRYGFPNDLLAHLHSAGARVAHVQVRPIYEGQSTGLRPLTAVPALSWVLARSWVLRLRRERNPCGS